MNELIVFGFLSLRSHAAATVLPRSSVFFCLWTQVRSTLIHSMFRMCLICDGVSSVWPIPTTPRQPYVCGVGVEAISSHSPRDFFSPFNEWDRVMYAPVDTDEEVKMKWIIPKNTRSKFHCLIICHLVIVSSSIIRNETKINESNLFHKVRGTLRSSSAKNKRKKKFTQKCWLQIQVQPIKWMAWMNMKRTMHADTRKFS